MKAIVVLLSLALTAMSLPGQSLGTSPKYSSSELRRMIRDAHTAADFERLSVYLDDKAEENEVKFRAEQDELDRLLALPFHARSYALQVENTRNRIDQFKSLYRKYSEQATIFRAWARRAPEGTSSVASPSL